MVKKYGATAVVSVALVVVIVLIGSFYLVGTGTPVADVVALLGAFGALTTAVVTILVKLDQQTETIREIAHNTNGALKEHVKEAVQEATDATVVPAVQSAIEGNGTA